MPPLQTVPRVDFDRYLGAWYEIAGYPHRSQAGCVASMATYSALPDGRIRLENQCRANALDGPVRRATGVAWAVPADASNDRGHGGGARCAPPRSGGRCRVFAGGEVMGAVPD